MESVEKYSNMISGYIDVDGERMRSFLECWREQTKNYADRENIPWVSKYTDRYQAHELEKLPVSFRNFWKVVSDVGWMSLYDLGEERRFLKIREHDYLKAKDHEYYQIFIETIAGYQDPDYKYYVYNKNQDDLGPTKRDIDNLLIVGSGRDSVIIGIIDNERSLDGEYQAYWYSPHQFGVRVKSFAHLLVHLYLQEYQYINSLDDSMDHIYFFDGDWGDTCVPLLFDEAEIASWSVQAPGRRGSLFGEIERN